MRYKYLIFTILFFFQSVLYSDEFLVKAPFRFLPEKLLINEVAYVDQARAIELIAETLVKLDDNFSFSPLVAQKYWWSNNGYVLNFELRDRFFSNGEKMTPDDVIKALAGCVFDSQSSPLSFLRSLVGYEKYIKTKKIADLGIKKVNKNQISLQLIKPSPLLLENLAHKSCTIVKNREKKDFFKGVLGTGPYFFYKRTNNSIILLRNKYYNDISIANRIELIEVENFYDYKSLNKWSDIIPTKSVIEKLENDYRRYDYSFLANWQLTFNLSQRNMKDQLVREAISEIVNFDVFLKELKWDRNRMQKSLIPFGMRGFEKRVKFQPNIDKSNKILRNKGFSPKKPLEVTILISKRGDGSENENLWLKAIKSEYIKVVPLIYDKNKYIEIKNSGKGYDLVYHGKAPGSVEPHILLSSYLSYSKINTIKSMTNQCDKYIEKSLQENDREARYKLYKISEKCLLNEKVVIPLATYNKGYMYIKKPWKLKRSNQFLLFPFSIHEWSRSVL